MMPAPRTAGPRKPHVRPLDPPGDSLATQLLSAAMLVLIFILAFIVLPVIA